MSKADRPIAETTTYIGKYLRHVREGLGMTIKQFEDKYLITNLIKIERGKHYPDIGTIEKLSKKLPKFSYAEARAAIFKGELTGDDKGEDNEPTIKYDCVEGNR
jgi:transcriptional regulator with XRE-family HTH domain